MYGRVPVGMYKSTRYRACLLQSVCDRNQSGSRRQERFEEALNHRETHPAAEIAEHHSSCDELFYSESYFYFFYIEACKLDLFAGCLI